MIERNDSSRDADPEETTTTGGSPVASVSEVSKDDEKADGLLDSSNPERKPLAENQAQGDTQQDIDEIDDGGWLCL